MLNHIQENIKQVVKTSYFAKAYSDVRLSNGKLIVYNEDGTNGAFIGIQDTKENYFYIRVLNDAVATDERVSSCGNNVMQANLRLVSVVFNDNVYSVSTFVSSRLKAAFKRLKINSVLTDYDTIWNNEIPGVEIRRYNALNVVSIDFTVKFSLKQIIADSPCKSDNCEPEKICKDGFVIIKDENGDIILEQLIPSGATVEKTIDISCQPATAVLKDSANNALSTTNIASGDSDDIIAPDGTINIVNTDNVPIQTETVRSGQTKSATIPNVSWTNTDGSSESTPYGDAIVCTPATSLAVDFSVDNATPNTNEVITFTDLTVGAIEWLWDFGDGNLSTLQNPTHTYKYAGTYTVTLFASDGTISGKEIKSNYVVVTLQQIVQTNLQAHYKAPQGASPSNMTLVSGAISQWNDETVNAFHLTQGTPTNRPTYNQTEITSPDGNVYGGASIDGTNDVLANSNVLFVRPNGNTVFMVIKHTGAPAGNRNFIAENGTAQFISTYANSISYAVNGATQTFTAYPFGEYFLIKFTFSSTNFEIRINDLLNRLVGATLVAAGVGFRLGNTSAPAHFVTTEIAIYNAIITGSNETEVNNYFNSKFGLWQ